MFAGFTDGARKVLALANFEAQRLSHEFIGTEHILLGLVKEEDCLGAKVIKNLGMELSKVRLELEQCIKNGPDDVAGGKLPQAPRAKQCIEYAIEEARGLGHSDVGTEHMLLGLLRVEDGMAAVVLTKLGVTYAAARAEVVRLVGAGVTEELRADRASARAPHAPFGRLTERARKVLGLANQEAQRLNHEYIGSEHILLGLVKEGSGVGATILKNLGVDLRQVRLDVEKAVKRGPDAVAIGNLPMTPEAKTLMEDAMEESRHLGHRHVGTEHLLLGMLKGEEGVAAEVLRGFGVKREVVRAEVLKLLGAG